MLNIKDADGDTVRINPGLVTMIKQENKHPQIFTVTMAGGDMIMVTSAVADQLEAAVDAYKGLGPTPPEFGAIDKLTALAAAASQGGFAKEVRASLVDDKPAAGGFGS